MPYIDFAVPAIAAVIFAVLHRMAGGGNSLGIGTQVTRVLLWAVPVGLLPAVLTMAGLSTLPLWCAPAIGGLTWMGRADTPHGAGQDLRVPWKTPDSAQGMDRIAKAERLGYLLSAGRSRYWLLSVPLVLAASPALVLLPLLSYGYLASYLIGLWLEGRGLVFRRWITFRCEWGEFLFGGFFGGTLTTILMHI
ncbi:hypothetical protein TSH7_01190 [Azospirillum sp. TSH7]|uniref:hypothetical protein n=1 Tax=unclassified Azospirillum TaxID=2630922 RepID=UPI000D61ADA8|nr:MULTISPECIES: hypothetical protein [unclassified Azospirillum]PWC69089.1 hypothetical protein TSH7_01190 [Azospirillum sp. TSH7]PWC71419.1 hypothetical protein TSH20_03885 [Azospirillum sp. TSH20]